MMSTLQKATASAWQRFGAVPIALGIIGLSMATPVIAQEKQMLRTLTVTGRGFEEIPATIAQVRLGVEVQGKTANDAQQEAARRSNAVVSLLRSRQVDRLETTGISLNPVYNYSNNRQTLTGYSATNTVSFRIAADRTGSLLDDAVKAGATRIDSVGFVASDEAISTAQKQALRKATQDAQAQADSVFSTLNFTRKEIVSVQINGAAPPVPLFADESTVRARLAQSAPAPSPVVSGQQRVEGSVTLQISY